jgi:hypothetical protein
MSLINCSDISKGDAFTFGSYGGKDIEWLVLDVQDDKALVISKKIIDKRDYNKKLESTTWARCDLRKWLKNDFYNQAFNSDERLRIAKTHVSNQYNSPQYGTDGGLDTIDYVFLLSIDEAKRYFSSALARMAYYDWRMHWWWLRSPGDDSNIAASVNLVGSVVTRGRYVINSDGGVRPALWIELGANSAVEVDTALIESRRTSIGDVNVGEEVFFGSYDGKDIEWLVLDVQDGKALMISVDSIAERAYHEEFEDEAWARCDLRKWLNNDFYNQAFNSDERSRIAITHVSNRGDPKYGTDGGLDTLDYVFLLSISEAERYLPSVLARVAYYKGERRCHWWLRSRRSNFKVAFVNRDGNVNTLGDHVDYRYCVRPALWLNFES